MSKTPTQQGLDEENERLLRPIQRMARGKPPFDPKQL